MWALGCAHVGPWYIQMGTPMWHLQPHAYTLQYFACPILLKEDVNAHDTACYSMAVILMFDFMQLQLYMQTRCCSNAVI